jgi:hypothetical protein
MNYPSDSYVFLVWRALRASHGLTLSPNEDRYLACAERSEIAPHVAAEVIAIAMRNRASTRQVAS